MPAKAPATPAASADALCGIGLRIRAQRKALGVSAASAAEAAGLSRVTLHRIERGEASVTMGAYLNVIAVVGLELNVSPILGGTDGSGTAPAGVRASDFPQLAKLAWQLPPATVLTAEEALGLYERNWRHVDVQAMDTRERALLDTLVSSVGKGHLLV